MRKAMLGNEVVDLRKLTKPEIMRLKKRRDLFCMTCKKPVILKNGTRKRPHFAHEKNGLSVSGPESMAHILVKHALAKWLTHQGIEAVVEQRFSAIDRIADVYFKYKHRKYVIEVQKSSMSDAEFNQRMLDYESIEVSVIWIFLGDVSANKNTFKLPAVMLGRGQHTLFHFCDKTAQLRIFEAPVFITTREIYAKTICGGLRDFQVADLMRENNNSPHFDVSWLSVKKYFRIQGWHYATRSEKKLLEQCLIRGFNLSLLPTEVGWPVAGDAIRKHLFIWQSYVLVTLMKHFSVGDVFNAGALIKLLEVEYKMTTCGKGFKQIIDYLKWLTMFGIIKKQTSYFEYVKAPSITTSMETYLKRDKKFAEGVALRSQRAEVRKIQM